MQASENPRDWTEGGARLAVCLAVAAPLLCFSVLHHATYSLPKLLALAAASCVAWAFIAAGAVNGTLRPYPTPLDRPLAGLAAAALVSTWLGDDRALSLIGRYRFYAYGLLGLGLYVGIYYASAWSKGEREPRALFRSLAAAGGLAGLYGLAQAAGIEPFAGVSRSLPEGGRVISTMGSPVYLGACLAMAAPVALHLALSSSGPDRLLGWASGAAALAGLAPTYSRGAWAAAAAGVLSYLWASGRLAAVAATGGRGGPAPGRDRRAFLAVGAGAALVVALGLFAASRRPTSASDFGRLQLWASAWRIARQNPLFGTGPDNFEAALRRHKTEGFIRFTGPRSGQSNAHNDLVQALATLGVAGLAAYLWLLWAVARLLLAGLADPASRASSAAAGAALLGLFVQAKVNPTPAASLAAAAALCGILARRPAGGAAGDGVGDRPDAAAGRGTPAPRPGGKGRLPAEEDGPAPGRRAWLPVAFGLASAGALALLLRLSSADRHMRRGVVFQAAGRMDLAAPEFPAAIRLHPLETDYRVAYCKFLIRAAERVQDPIRRLRLIEEAVRVGEEAVRLRPGHVDGYQLVGAMLIELRRAGGADRLGEAERALDRALELDPTFPPLLENRLQLARLKGDASRVEELQRRLRELERLSPR